KDVYYIKRVIGLPGERVLIENGSIYIFNNSKPTGTRLNEEEYSLDHKIVKSEKDDLTLKDDEYYLIGDNRTNSLDSRRIGPIKIDFIKGRAWVRAFPFDDFSIFKAPNYNF
ncbi:signal peptidase I, partial [bacterium]|nr:signal peptidase I [bacterium]